MSERKKKLKFSFKECNGTTLAAGNESKFPTLFLPSVCRWEKALKFKGTGSEKPVTPDLLVVEQPRPIELLTLEHSSPIRNLSFTFHLL